MTDEQTQGVLRLDELFPEKDYFELKEGESIPFLSAAELDAIHTAILTRLENSLKSCKAKLSQNGADEEAARQFDDTASDFVKFVLPDLPDEVLERLHLGQKVIILNWWTERNRKVVGQVEGEAEA